MIQKSALVLFLLIMPIVGFAGGGSNVKLESVKIDLMDFASLQRGARIYMDRCLGCHSLKFMRYDGLEGIGIVDEEGELLKDLIEDNLMFVGKKLSDPILTAMAKSDGEKWFGMAPPDLSLVSRSRGADWLYSYLKGFYIDPTRPFGVNNTIFPDVGMPHVFLDWQGEQHLQKGPNGEQLVQVKAGSLSLEDYNTAMTDLVNFLSYVGEPIKLERQRIGLWVMVFIAIFTVFAYLLKREYWKNVH